MNNFFIFTLLASLFLATVYASDQINKAEQLPVAQKLLLYNRTSLELYCWADYDSKTIGTLSRVNRELRDTINFARNALIQKHSKKITLEKPMFNRYNEWCSFGTTKTKAMEGSYLFFGNSFADEFCSACSLDTDTCATVSTIIPITTATWSGFHIRRIDNAHRDVIVIPQAKEWWYISYTAKDTHLFAFLNHWNTTIGQFKKTYSQFIDPIITAFKDGAEDVDEKALTLTRTCGMVPEKVRVTINLDDHYFASLCEPFRNNYNSNNGVCKCTTNHIDDACRKKYASFHALLQDEGLDSARKLLHDKFLQHHVLHTIMENKEQNATLYVNPHGELIIEVDGVKKHFYSQSNEIYRLSLENESTDNQHDSALDAKYAAKTEHIAQQISIVGDNLCHYASHGALHDIRILHLVLSKDYSKSMPFKLSLPEEYTVTDCIVKEVPGTSHLLCIALLTSKNNNSPSALFYCDVGEWYNEGVTECTHHTVEQAQKYFYDHVNQTNHWPRFTRQLIRAPSAVLETTMQWIRMNHENKLLGSEKNPIQCLNFPNSTDDQITHNKDLPVFFKPNNPLDRLWYALYITRSQFGGLQKYGDIDLEECHATGGLCAVVVGIVGDILTGHKGFFSTFLLGTNGCFHGFTNKLYKGSTDTPWIRHLLPYPIFGLASYYCCNGFIPQLAYTTLPLWFHVFDRLYMFIKPLPVKLSLGILYNSFPSRIRRGYRTMIAKSGTYRVESLSDQV